MIQVEIMKACGAANACCKFYLALIRTRSSSSSRNHRMRSRLLFSVLLFQHLSILEPYDSEQKNMHSNIEIEEVNDIEMPFIGIMTRPEKFLQHGDEFVDATYVRFLQMAGAQVVPVRPKRDQQYYAKVFNSINGLFLPGGAASDRNSTFRDTGEIMFKLAIEANDRGDYFPVWGTCSGFEMMIKLINDEFLFHGTNTKNRTLPVKFIPGFEKSRLFRHMPKQLIKYLSEENITHNNHKYSALMKHFEASEALTEFYQALATSQDEIHEFISIFEAYNYPFYAVQWHPERSIFSRSKNLTVNRSSHSRQVSQYLANFFVSETQKNSHHFESQEEEAHAIIENAKRIFEPNFNIGERYYFNYTNDNKY